MTLQNRLIFHVFLVQLLTLHVHVWQETIPGNKQNYSSRLLSTSVKPYRIVKPANASARKEPKTMGKWNFFIADMIPIGNKILGDPKSEGNQLNPTINSKNSYKTELAPNVNKSLRLRRQSSVGGSGGRNWDPLYQH